MGPIAWRSEHSLGDADIDAQHRHILEMVRALHEAGEGAGAETIDLLVAHLSRYLVSHFEAEEKFMEESGYPGLFDHRAEHRDCMDKLRELVEGINACHGSNLRIMAAFVAEWMLDHIMHADQELAEFARGKPASRRPNSQSSRTKLPATM